MTAWHQFFRNEGFSLGCLAILAGSAVGYGIAGGMGIMKGDINAWIAADNFVTAVVAWGTAAVWFLTFEERMKWTRADRVYLRNFVAILLAALALHRGYWYPWRAHLFHGSAEAADAYKDSFVMLTTIPQSMWWLCCFGICAPLYRRRLGDAWPLYALLLTITIWTIGYQGVTLFEPAK